MIFYLPQFIEPHIGHLYSLVTADIFARFRRLTEPHRPVYFVTGTDEHGLKIQQAAKARGLHPSIFCRKQSLHFRV
jgi:methionyl-tRNA synthetase